MGRGARVSQAESITMPGAIWFTPVSYSAGCTCPSSRSVSLRICSSAHVRATSSTREPAPSCIRLSSWDATGWSGLEVRRPCSAIVCRAGWLRKEVTGISPSTCSASPAAVRCEYCASPSGRCVQVHPQSVPTPGPKEVLVRMKLRPVRSPILDGALIDPASAH